MVLPVATSHRNLLHIRLESQKRWNIHSLVPADTGEASVVRRDADIEDLPPMAFIRLDFGSRRRVPQRYLTILSSAETILSRDVVFDDVQGSIARLERLGCLQHGDGRTLPIADPKSKNSFLNGLFIYLVSSHLTYLFFYIIIHIILRRKRPVVWLSKISENDRVRSLRVCSFNGSCNSPHRQTTICRPQE
jgi:hypothetical protein